MRIDCLLLRRRDCSVASNGMTAVHVGVGRSGASRFDRIVPAVRPDKVCQGAAITVGPVLRWVGFECHSLPRHGRLRELRRLGSPAADGIAGLFRFGRINSQEPHAKTATDIAKMLGVSRATVYRQRPGPEGSLNLRCDVDSGARVREA